MDKKNIGAWLKNARLYNHLSCEEVAKRARISLSMLLKIEEGNSTPPEEIAKRIAVALGIPAAVSETDTGALTEEVKQAIDAFGKEKGCILGYVLINGYAYYTSFYFDARGGDKSEQAFKEAMSEKRESVRRMSLAEALHAFKQQAEHEAIYSKSGALSAQHFLNAE